MNPSHLHKLKKKTFFIIGSLFALVASYIIADESHSVSIDIDQNVPTAYADIPSGYVGSGGDDCGDSGDDCR